MEITGELLLEFKVNTRHDMWESVDEWPKPSEAESQEPAYSVSIRYLMGSSMRESG